MPDRIVKPDTGNDLVLQNDDASAKIEINEDATINFTGTVAEFTVDNIKIDGNTIVSTNTNGNIDLTPNGTGEVNISKVDIDSGTIDGTDVTVGSSKTLDVSAGTLTSSTAQKTAIVDGGKGNLAKSDVGLGNVTNESKATMFTSPAFTGTASFSGSIDQGDGQNIQTDEIRARDGDGLKLRDSGGSNGIFVENGGFVGIGIDDPNNQLSVQGNSNYLLNLKQTGSVIHMLAMRGPSSAGIDFACDGANNKVKMISLGSGDAIEFVTEDSTTKLTIASNGSIGAPSGTNIYNASDLRLKKNVNNLTGSLEKINQMQGVSFEWIDGFCPEESGKIHYGLIAQDLTKIDSNLISEFGNPIEARDAVLDDKGNIIKEAIEASPNKITAGDQVIENPLRVEEKFIIPLLIEAVKTLSEKVSGLENA